MEEKRGKQGEPVADAVYEMLNTMKQKTRSGDDWEMNQWIPIVGQLSQVEWHLR